MYIISRNHKPRVICLDDPNVLMSVIKFLYLNHIQVDILVTNSEIKHIPIHTVDEMIINPNATLMY